MKKSPGEFSRRVWELAMMIPAGRITTYGLLARVAGATSPSQARSITSILSKAPNPESIPFHRIVYSDGRVWFAPGYETKRRRYYRHEGILLDNRDRIIDFEEKLFRFDE
jgi:methylated-DNA-protein-cysteine methyltransferase-like protein